MNTVNLSSNNTNLIKEDNMSKTTRSACRNKHDEQWLAFCEDYYSSHRKQRLSAFEISPAMSEKQICDILDIEWCDSIQFGETSYNRDNLYYILIMEISNINYAQDIYNDDNPELEERHQKLVDVFNALYEGRVPSDIIRDDFNRNNDC